MLRRIAILSTAIVAVTVLAWPGLAAQAGPRDARAMVGSVNGADTMGPSTVLSPGQQLVSSNGAFTLVMQTDGNLVDYTPSGVPIWSSRTSGHADAYATMQADGNFVVYSDSGQPLWNSHSSGHAGAHATIQADGNFVVYDGYRPLFNGFADQPPPPAAIDLASPSDYTLNSGGELEPGQTLTHAQYRAVMQADGNFVVYQNYSQPLWSSRTSVAGSSLRVQADGNMVIYAPDGHPVWSTNSSGSGSDNRLVLQLDGNLVLYRADNTPAWNRLRDTGSLIAPPLPPTEQFTLSRVGTLYPGDQLSFNSYVAAMQTDGNFVVYNGSTPLWNTHTSIPGSSLVLQADGNIVIYSPSGSALWTTATEGVSQLVMQSDGNLVAYRDNGSAAWNRLHDTSRSLGAAPNPSGAGAPASQTGVHPGAFCSPSGATGSTSDGIAMICSPTSASPDRARWHAA